MEHGEALSPTEDVLVRAMALRTFRQLEWQYREEQAGRLATPLDLEVFRPGFRGQGIFRWPLGEYWRDMKEFMAPDFVEYVEQNIVDR